MSICDTCPKANECMIEGWEPCAKSIAWEELTEINRNPNYKPKGMANSWPDQKTLGKSTGRIRLVGRKP